MTKFEILDRVLELLAKAERSVDELSTEIGTREEVADYVLRILLEHGIIEFKNGKYRLTETGRKLAGL